jgi:hypothetical protein
VTWQGQFGNFSPERVNLSAETPGTVVTAESNGKAAMDARSGTTPTMSRRLQ